MSGHTAEKGLPDFGCPECNVAGGHYPTCSRLTAESDRPACTCSPARIDGYLIHRQGCARSVTTTQHSAERDAALAEAAAWIAESIGYPVEVKMPDHPMPAALWEALVDHVHADVAGRWHGQELTRHETASWLADEAGRVTPPGKSAS